MAGRDSPVPLDMRITRSWVQDFQDHYNLVHRTQTWKLSVSPAKTEFIERHVAYHMGELKRGFLGGILDENLMENIDETHFMINMDNGKTVGFRGDQEVRYADVVSDGVGMTMVVQLTGGPNAKIGVPFMIFSNKDETYPIRGIPDNRIDVCYRTTRKSFMTSKCLAEYYSERRVNLPAICGGIKMVWMDNYPGHNQTPAVVAALGHIRYVICEFPANATHLIQPADSFVISKIKDAWQRRWEEKKMDMILAGMWQGDGQAGTSGSLQNPQKPYFLALAAEAVKDVNKMIAKKKIFQQIQI
ncbi:hypothetical protein R1sor_021585 [Riccia sorocarpa]|uniref:DDE-1 domain-containing protein n=1 Tax=Riccia sorocarpa TaxID=122646 RepID=A0ABD3GJL9_9MARC